MDFDVCLQFVKAMLDVGLLQPDPELPGNVFVYRTGVHMDDCPIEEGWFSEELPALADELSQDEDSFIACFDAVVDQGFSPVITPDGVKLIPQTSPA